MRITEHFHLQAFLYAVFQRRTRGAFEKHLRLRFYKNRQQILPASIMMNV